MKSKKEESNTSAGAEEDLQPVVTGEVVEPERKRRVTWFVAYALLLTGVFALPLVNMFRHALGTEIHSHIILIPVVTGWLLWTDRSSLRVKLGTSVPGAAVCGILAVLAVIAWLGRLVPDMDGSDAYALMSAAYLLFMVAGVFLFAGSAWMWKAAFPVFFLIFMIPLPDRVVTGMENALMVASADATDWLFRLIGTPVYRVGQDFHLPGFSLSVAQECSGIRSSWVLFITSLLASHLFLRSNWKRTLLVALVIPLGILRNGVRIVVIGMLCVHQGPHMIDSWIHHRGGPFFFALSLVPLFFLLWWLRRRERGEDMNVQH